MNETSVRISNEHKARIEEVADQVHTSIKAVTGMIIDWFFETDWGNPDVIARLMADYEDEDEDEDEDVEGPDLIGEILGVVQEDEEEDDDDDEDE